MATHNALETMDVNNEAVLIQNGRVIGRTHTTRAAGSVVSYGADTAGGVLVQEGRATISKAKRYLKNSELMSTLVAMGVNVGGGQIEW